MTFELEGEALGAFNQHGRLLVLGGPGSGKTTLSLLKAQALMPTLLPGQQVLFLSFSRAAVRQVVVRCGDVLSRAESELISVQTYHSFCMNILKAHGRLQTGRPVQILFPDREKVAKATFDGDWELETNRLAAENGVYAFDLFAAGAVSLVKSVDRVADLVADKSPIIILDEFQDTSDSQWELVKLLAQRSLVIMLADPDQRIFDYDIRVDPKRLDQVRDVLKPHVFDLTGQNHRSPDAGILNFADAVLRNSPLPTTTDVLVKNVYPYALDSTVHAAVVHTFGLLRKAGVNRPSVAVLARSNDVISDVSNALSGTHTFGTTVLKPVQHEVLWDADLAASSAQVIASVLEWPTLSPIDGVILTLTAIASFFETKSAIKSAPVKSALALRDTFLRSAAQVHEGRQVGTKAAKQLVARREEEPSFRGDPAKDWLLARQIIADTHNLFEVAQAARFVRLFGASDEIGGRLSSQWDTAGTYASAMDLVRRALDASKLETGVREPRGCVLMNIHKSKGKEFDAVVIVEGIYKGRFFDERREPAPYWSSRRLLRVAITRARHGVIIVRPKDSLPLVDP